MVIHYNFIMHAKESGKLGQMTKKSDTFTFIFFGFSKQQLCTSKYYRGLVLKPPEVQVLFCLAQKNDLKSECLRFSVSLCISVKEFAATPVGDDKWLSLWVNYWFADSLKNSDLFRNKIIDWLCLKFAYSLCKYFILFTSQKVHTAFIALLLSCDLPASVVLLCCLSQIHS